MAIRPLSYPAYRYALRLAHRRVMLLIRLLKTPVERWIALHLLRS